MDLVIHNFDPMNTCIIAYYEAAFRHTEKKSTFLGIIFCPKKIVADFKKPIHKKREPKHGELLDAAFIT